MTIGEKSSEYAEKCFRSDDISNSGKHDVAFHSYGAGARWMIDKAAEWFKNQKEEIGISWYEDFEIRFRSNGWR